MRNSIFTYQNKKDCAYCRHNDAKEGVVCALQSEKHPCDRFCYDVFKRIPKKTPKLQQFDKAEFEI